MSKNKGGFFTSIFKKTVSMFATASPDDYEGWTALYGAPTQSSSGETVTADTAMQVGAVYACVGVISDTIAATPIHMYKKLGGGNVERASTHPLQHLFHEAANAYQSSFEFKQMMQAHALLRGNAYALKVRSALKNGLITELVPIHPDRVHPQWMATGEPYYMIDPPPENPGAPRRFSHEEIWHFRGMSLDGKMGVSPITYHRETMGLALAQMKHGGRLFANGAQPGGTLEHPGTLGDKALEHLKESLSEKYGGKNVFKPMVLEEGMKWNTITMTNLDAQYLEGRKFSRSEIASLFRVPPHKIGDLEKATFSNIEQQSIEFVTDCILPWARRWEASIIMDLVDVPLYYYPEFLLDAMMRGDLKTRYEAYGIARMWGWFSVNDILRRENQNPIGEKGDIYLQPANYTEAGSTPPAPPPAPPNAGDVAKALALLWQEMHQSTPHKG